MALLWLSCPHCRVLFHIDDANAGQQVACRACGNPVRIPGAVPKPPLWYYTYQRKPLGPVTLEQLKELARVGELPPDEMVWHEGMAQWTEARTVEGLYPVPPPVPPPPQVEEEPVIEVVEDEPVEAPVPLAPEPAEPLAPEPAAPKQEEPAGDLNGTDWDTEANRPASVEEPLPVEPEFKIDFAGAPPPPVRRGLEPPPTVDLVFPAKAEPAVPHDIELAPVEPKLELGEPEDTGPAKPYDLAAWSGHALPEVVAVPDASVPPPAEPYPIAGDSRPAAEDTNIVAAIPVAGDAAGPPPMAIPIPPREQRPRRETEEDEKDRLRQELRQGRVAWTKVRTGINLDYLAFALWFAIIAGTLLIGTIIAVFSGESMSGSQESDAGSVLTTVLLLLIAIVVDTVATVGFCYCLQVPETAGSRTLALTTVIVTGMALFGAFVALFLPTWFRFVVIGVGFARWIVFLFFMQTVAQHFDAHLLLKDIERVLVLLTATVGLSVALWIGMAYLTKTFGKGESDTASMLTMTCGALCTSLPQLALFGLATIRYLRVMRDTVALIDQRLYRS